MLKVDATCKDVSTCEGTVAEVASGGYLQASHQVASGPKSMCRLHYRVRAIHATTYATVKTYEYIWVPADQSLDLRWLVGYQSLVIVVEPPRHEPCDLRFVHTFELAAPHWKSLHNGIVALPPTIEAADAAPAAQLETELSRPSPEKRIL